IPDEEKVTKLFRAALKLTNNVWLSHIAFASVMAKPSLIERLTEMLNSKSNKELRISSQVGIETGSPRLVREHMRGKVAPFQTR
ncbi:unnamed protein product, partial [marine sediment metagenome]